MTNTDKVIHPVGFTLTFQGWGRGIGVGGGGGTAGLKGNRTENVSHAPSTGRNC